MIFVPSKKKKDIRKKEKKKKEQSKQKKVGFIKIGPSLLIFAKAVITSSLSLTKFQVCFHGGLSDSVPHGPNLVALATHTPIQGLLLHLMALLLLLLRPILILSLFHFAPIFHCEAALGSIAEEDFSEELLLRPLPDRKVLAHFHFQSRAPHTNSNGRHHHLFPKAISQLVSHCVPLPFGFPFFSMNLGLT